MRIIHWLILLLACSLLPMTATAANKVVVLQLTGAIGPASSDYVERSLRDPVVQDGSAIILYLDTPGGLDSAMRDIIQAILSAPVPVVAYVAPSGARAASAGAYILYASHIAAMAPGTNVGAATPVQLGGRSETPEQAPAEEQAEPQSDSAMQRKIINDAVAYIRSLAVLRGRNADWAEQAVRDAVSIGAEEALAEGVIELVAIDLDDLLSQLDGRSVPMGAAKLVLATADAEIIRLEPDWRTRVLSVLTNPNVAYILMLIGIYGLIFEFASPGSMVPGVLGAIALVLALFAFQALPISYAGLALVLLGLAFMVAEAFVASFGILGIGGVISFVIGSIMLFDTGSPAFRISLALIAGFAIVSVLLLAGLVAMLLRSRRRPVTGSADDLLGARGEAVYAFTGRGQVRLRGEIWNADSREPLAADQPVRVIARHGLRLEVEPLRKR